MANVLAFSCSFIISFVLTPFIIESVGKEAYSFYPLANNIVGYIAIATIALNSMLGRYISISFNGDKIEESSQYYTTAFYANIILIALLITPVYFFVDKVDNFLDVPPAIITNVKTLFIYVFLSMLLDLVSNTYAVSTFVTDRLDIRAGFELTKNILKVLLFSILFYIAEPSLEVVGKVTFIISVVNLVGQYYLSKKLITNIEIRWRYFNLHSLKSLLSSGSWNVINSLGVSLLLGLALFFTNRFLGASDAGELALAMLLPSFITSIISMLSSVLVPRLTRTYAKSGVIALRKDAHELQKIMSLLSTMPICVVLIMGDHFFELWLPTEYTSDLKWLSLILIFPLVIHSNVWCLYNVNIILNKLKPISLSLLGFGLINVFMYKVLCELFPASKFNIPIVSSVLNVIFYAVVVPYLTSKSLQVNFSSIFSPILKSVIFSLLVVVTALQFNEMFTTVSWIQLFVKSLALLLIGLLLHAAILFDISLIKKRAYSVFK